MRTAVFVIAATLLAPLPADAIVKCRTPDGQLHFADSPPPGCEVEGESRRAPPSR